MQFITSGDRIATENFTLGRIYTVTFNNGNYFINTCIGIGPDYVMFQQTAPKMLFKLDMSTAANVDTIDESGGGAGTMNYNELENKPQINGETLQGDKSLSDLGIASASDLAGKQDVISDLDTIRSGAAAGATAVQPATLSGYQTLIDSSHKLSSDLVDDTGHDNKFATAAQLSQIETNKNNILSLIENGGGKNLLPLSITTAQTVNGVIFTPQNDGTIKVTGELNAANAPLVIGTIELPAGTYILSGSPTGGSESTWQIDTTTPLYYQDTGLGVSITLSATTTVTVRIRIAASGTLDLLFKPMLSTSTDRTFQPYCPSNFELYQMILAL